LLALGLCTPAAVSMLTGVMTNAIRHVHGKNGLWVTDGGVEYPVVVLAALAALADSGPGRFSLDEALGIQLRGPVVTALAMGAGAAGAVYVAERGEELFAKLDADDALSRSVETVGAES
jgi:putative oxidoreductase